MLGLVPSAVDLQGPVEPYAVSGSFWPNSEALHDQN
jgi:hypothetical protein